MRGVWIGTLLVVIAIPSSVSARQESSPAAPNLHVDDAVVAHIRVALASPPPLRLGEPVFHVDIVARSPTWHLDPALFLRDADVHQSSASSGPPGVDLLQMALWAVHEVRGKYREHQVRLIRERIDKELEILGRSAP
jgi:hypothetical protein